MARRTLSRGLVAAAATAAAMVTAIAPLSTATAATAPAATAATATTATAARRPAAITPTQTIVPAPYPAVLPDDPFTVAGITGYLHEPHGGTGYQWTTYATGTTTPVGGYLDDDGAVHTNGSGDDTVVTVGSGADDGKLVFTDMATGRATAVLRPAGGTTLGQFGGRILQADSATGVPAVLALNATGTATVSTPVTGWPSDDAVGAKPLGGDTRSAVVLVRTAAGYQLAVIDLATAGATVVPGTVTADTAVDLGASRIAWWPASAPGTVHLVDRGDPSAAATGVTLPGTGTVYAVRVVGDWVVAARGTAGDVTLRATPAGGGDSVDLGTDWDPATLAQDGDALVGVGKDVHHDWSLLRLTRGADGRPAVATVRPALPPEHVDQLILSGGTLLTAAHDPSTSSGTESLYTRTVTLPGDGERPVAGDQSGIGTAFHLGTLFGDGTGTGAFTTLYDGDALVSPGPSRSSTVKLPITGGRIVAADNKYTVVDAADGKQYVFRNGRTTPMLTRPAQAAGLWGDTLVSADSANALTRHDLLTGAEGRYAPDITLPCTANGIQTVGDWIYWSCADGHAGLAHPDGDATQAFDVPAGPAILGDGFLVRHDLTRGELTVTDLTRSTYVDDPSPQPQDLAPLPAPAGGTDDRNVTFTADPYSGGVAYVGAGGDVHLVEPGLADDGHPVTTIDATVRPPALVAADRGLTGGWLLSAPVTSVVLTVHDEDGRPIATVPGTVSGNGVGVTWNGKEADGTTAPNGEDTFEVMVSRDGGPPDGEVAWGAFRFTRMTGSYRDPQGNGLGSVVTMNSAGYLTTHTGTAGSGSLDTFKAGGSGYATGDLAVPFGPLRGDGCDDTLVRTTAGELRDYPTGCGHLLGAANTAYTSLGTGWNQYKALLYSGDMNDDGLPDLLAWSASTGDLYLYPGTAAGKLGARVLVKADQQYVRFIAVGDVDGDGIGDLLAYDHEHTLWVLYGDGKGGFRPRGVEWTDWGAGYNAMTGVGDINGDGHNDVVERDSAGRIWMNPGLPHAGSFGGRVQVGTGWQGYEGLF